MNRAYLHKIRSTYWLSQYNFFFFFLFAVSREELNALLLVCIYKKATLAPVDMSKTAAR